MKDFSDSLKTKKYRTILGKNIEKYREVIIMMFHLSQKKEKVNSEQKDKKQNGKCTPNYKSMIFSTLVWEVQKSC